ncbi:MAG: LytTR family DNA-binding domain-containing protein [Firmicutes bacterium]|nr:LytTR family DNA-binding domain-containing protein [Bacillota bacterium]
MLKAIIVEDEYPARMELRYLLEPYQAQIEIISEAQTAREALSLIESHTYDVAFLDIQMPGISGMDLARQLKTIHPQLNLVFISAHDNYAVDAFALDVVDYLLKPVASVRIAETMRRLLHQPKSEEKPLDDALNSLQWVPCEWEGRTIPIAVSDIIYVMAEHEIIYIMTEKERHSTRFTLQELQERLPSNIFLRTHRSFIANMSQVKELTPYFNGNYLLKMKDQNHSEVLVSRSNVKRVKEWFNIT